MNGEAYEAHPLWTTLDDTQALLENDLGPQTQEERDVVRRAHATAEFLDGLRSVDPALVDQPQVLNDLNNYLGQVNNQIRAIPDAPANLAALAGPLQQIWALRGHFPTPSADEATRAMKAASTRYKNALDAEVESLREANEGLRAKFAEAEQERTEADAAAEQRLAELNQRIAEREAEIDALAAKLQAQIDTQRATFEEDMTARQAAFQEAEQQREVSAGEAVEAVAQAAATQREEQREHAAGLLKELEAFRGRAEALVDTTSRHAIAGDYTTWASKQGRAGFFWTLTAVAFGVVTIGVLIYALKSASDDTLQFTLYKSSISFVGLIMAGYAARQASEHRHQERTAKRLALDLTALEPFLANVEDAETIRSAVAKRVFAPDEIAQTDGSPALRTRRGGRMSIQELTELVKAFQGVSGQ